MVPDQTPFGRLQAAVRSDCPDGRPPSLDQDINGAAPNLVPGPRRAGNYAKAVARLSGANALVLIAGLVGGPITARALGPNGRGELAAITATLTVGPWLLDLGLTQWVARERALGHSRSTILGAALPVALACSLIGVVAAIPISHILGRGRPVVTDFLQVGLFLMPISVLLTTLAGLAVGDSDWKLYSLSRVLGGALPAASILVLAIAGHLTVAWAAGAYVGGTLPSALLFLRTIRGVRRLQFDWQRSLVAMRFGVKSWLTTVAGTATNRLDQLLMAGLVASRELGLYAVAVTLASITGTVAGSAATALIPRVADGDGQLAARSCRITVSIVAMISAMLAAISPTMIPVVFGTQFDGAIEMAIILLAASIPMATATILGSALSAANDPAAAMRAELVALALTIPALIIVLPSSGGVGAAVVSFAAYSLRAVLQLRSAAVAFGLPWRRFLLPTGPDLDWVVSYLTRFNRRA